jgi:N utilization substance protein A
MSSEMALAIRQLVQERGISEELVHRTIEESLLAAYKRKYGTSDNAVVRFSEDGTDVTIFAQKSIVDEVEDPVLEISLADAREYNEESEVGDELLIEINPREFDRISIQSAKQKTKQALREIQKDTLYSEFKDKVGEMIIGYYQRERNGTIYVDLGKTEGILPKRFQSPREVYHTNDRIKALIHEVTKSPTGLQIVLSRTHSEFVKRIFELEVPEVYDSTVGVFKIVREPGYRTKIAVYSNRDDVDPVGACVGLKGVRIQNIVREMEGEKIDILKYDPSPTTFIKNSLSPVEVLHVVLLDEAKKQALAIVAENQFSLAIGKQGLNVRLANRLTDWNIDIKTEEQFAEMDIAAETKRAVSALFGEVEEEEISRISELPGISERLVEALNDANLDRLEDLVSMTEESLVALEGITPDDASTIMKVIEENVEIVEETEEGGEIEAPEAEAEEAAVEADEIREEVVAEAQDVESEVESDEEELEQEQAREVELEEVESDEKEIGGEEEELVSEEYECPECSAKITVDMTSCPNCGVGLSFEEEIEEEEVEEEGVEGADEDEEEEEVGEELDQ